MIKILSGILLRNKKEWSMVACKIMHVSQRHYAEGKTSVLNGYIISDVIDNAFWKKTILVKENRLVAARGWGGGRV